jgi:hypothetical protein
MIRVQVTERLIFEANEFIENIKNAQFENSHDYKEEHKIIGALGEIALIDYCWNNDLLAFKKSKLRRSLPTLKLITWSTWPHIKKARRNQTSSSSPISNMSPADLRRYGFLVDVRGTSSGGFLKSIYKANR